MKGLWFSHKLSYCLGRLANKNSKPLTVVSVFSGAGGLDLGLEAAGFSTLACVEIDSDCRETIRINRPQWHLSEPGNIFELAPEELLSQIGAKPKQITLLAGGPPCQPFSKASFWAECDSKRLSDPRARTLKSYLAYVEAMQPEALLFENVKGISFAGKDEGLRLLMRGLKRINKKSGAKYDPQVFVVNAADYGVPQFRERIFVIAHRRGKKFVMPPPTHGEDPNLLPYLTAWDALAEVHSASLEDLEIKGKWASLLPSIPEGANYLHHTERGAGKPLFGWRTKYWTFLLKLAKDRPSSTIQASPGPSTGPFHWDNRRLSTEELARLQTFPMPYRFFGNRGSIHRQIGNAVPSALGELMGKAMMRQFFGKEVSMQLTCIPKKSKLAPPPQKTNARIPRVFSSLAGKHRAHPGTGLGPRAKKLRVVKQGRKTQIVRESNRSSNQ